MQTVLNQMIKQLSPEDKSTFTELAIKLNQLKGDVSQLSEKDLKIISEMEKKYADKLSGFEEDIKKNPIDINNDSQNEPNQFSILDSAFAGYVRQLLARDLSSQFPKEEDAIKFSFQNKV